LAWLPPVGIASLKYRFRVPGLAGFEFHIFGHGFSLARHSGDRSSGPTTGRAQRNMDCGRTRLIFFLRRSLSFGGVSITPSLRPKPESVESPSTLFAWRRPSTTFGCTCLVCASFDRTDLEKADSARCCRFRNSQQIRVSDLDSRNVWIPKLDVAGSNPVSRSMKSTV
jgi:hypothetical protein